MRDVIINYKSLGEIVTQKQAFEAEYAEGLLSPNMKPIVIKGKLADEAIDKAIETDADVYAYKFGDRAFFITNEIGARYETIPVKQNNTVLELKHRCDEVSEPPSWLLDMKERQEHQAPDFYGTITGRNGKQRKGKLKYNVFVNWFMKEHKFITHGGKLYMFREKDGIYVDDYQKIEHDILNILPESTNMQRKEILSQISLHLADVPHREPDGEWYITFNNGTYDIRNQKLIESSPEYFMRNKIPHNYNENAKCPAVDKCMDAWTDGDKDLQKLLWEMIGYMLIDSTKMKAFFLIQGEKNNGKSTFTNMIKNAIGIGNCANLELRKLSDRFSLAHIDNKLLAIGSDLPDSYIDSNSAGVLRQITGDDCVQVERKGKDPYDMYFGGVYLGSCNDIPRIKDTTAGAVENRMYIIPFNHDFLSDNTTDRSLKDKIQTEQAAEYILAKAVKSLINLLERGEFERPKSIKKKLEEFSINNSSVVSFIKSDDGSQLFECSSYAVVKDVYEEYKKYCQDEGYQPVASSKFRKIICDRVGLKVIKTNGGKGSVVFTFNEEKYA